MPPRAVADVTPPQGPPTDPSNIVLDIHPPPKRKGVVSLCLGNPVVVFLITVSLRLAAFAFLPELETAMGTDAWVAHPSAPGVNTTTATSRLLEGGHYGTAGPSLGPWLRPFQRTTPQGLFFSHYNAEEMAPSFPLRFSSTIPPMEASVWRDVVFLKQRLMSETAPPMADGINVLLPDYLRSLAPWYAQFIPPVLAQQPWSILLLTLFDGVTATIFAGLFPSTDTTLLYLLFVCCPFTIAACIYESLQPLEMLLLTCIVEACRRAGRWSRGDDDDGDGSKPTTSKPRRVVFLSLAVLASLFLGCSFLGVTVALLFPIGLRSRRMTMLAALSLTVFVGVYALGIVFFDTHEKTPHGSKGTGSILTTSLGLNGYARKAELSTLYAPLDNGVLWYVRQVVLPVFEENLALVLLQVPALSMIPLCSVMPEVGQYIDAFKRKRRAGGKVPSAMIQPLFKDTKVFVVIFSVFVSLLYRFYFNLAYMFFGLLLIYSNANGKATERVRSDPDSVVPPVVRSLGQLSAKEKLAMAAADAGHKVRTFAAHERARILIPLYMLIIFAACQLGLYVSFCLYEVSNANWLFFSGVAVSLAHSFFLAAWLDAVAEDIVKIERQVEGW